MATRTDELTRQELLDEIAQLKAEVTRLQINNNYAEIFAASPVPMILTDLESGDYLASNNMFCQLSGFSQAELAERVSAEGRPINPLLRLQLSTLLPEHETVQKFETIVYNKQGEAHFVIVSSRVVEFDRKQFALSAFYDITESKEAREVLLRSEELYRTLARTLPDTAVFLYDFDLRFIKAEGSILTAVNLSSSGMEGKTLKEVVPAQRYPKLEAYYRTALVGEAESFEDTPGNGKTYWVKAVPVRDEDSQIVAGMVMIQDITERKAVERLKNEFVSTVSHELRTPLTSIRGALGLVLGGIAGQIPPQANSMIEIAYKNSERLVRLINDILDVEKIESGKMVFDMGPLDLNHVIEQALEANQAYATQLGVKLYLQTPVPEAKIMGDSDRILQVLTNLLSNASKFSPTGDTVEVAVTEQDDRVRVSISDHGPGIPDSFRKNIFQKFAQADSSATRQKGGTGLGLSISKAIVEKHEGTIGYASKPGEGTTFYFELPKFVDRCALLERPASIELPRILICEDDPDVSSILKVMLNQAGYSCDIVYNTEQARALLKTHFYAGLTLDLILPGEDGATFFRELRLTEATHNLPIIVISSLSSDTRREVQDIQGSYTAWVDKPVEYPRLKMVLDRLVRQIDPAKEGVTR